MGKEIVDYDREMLDNYCGELMGLSTTGDASWRLMLSHLLNELTEECNGLRRDLRTVPHGHARILERHQIHPGLMLQRFVEYWDTTSPPIIGIGRILHVHSWLAYFRGYLRGMRS